MASRAIPVTVVAMPEFERQAHAFLTDADVLAVLTSIAENPESGEVMSGTGGLRKVRSRVANRGKSGGARVIYGYFGPDLPIFVFTCFQKNQKENLSKAERNAIKGVVNAVVESYRSGLANRIKVASQKVRESKTYDKDEKGKGQGA